MRISDWSSDVCSSDELGERAAGRFECRAAAVMVGDQKIAACRAVSADRLCLDPLAVVPAARELQNLAGALAEGRHRIDGAGRDGEGATPDRKSTRLNSSH